MKYLNKDYIPKGELIGFPLEVIDKMLECQVLSKNPVNVSLFEIDIYAGDLSGGFLFIDFDICPNFWKEVITFKNFDLFFKHYPKMEEKFEPKRGDYVLVQDRGAKSWSKEIFLTYIEGAEKPVITLHPHDSYNYKHNIPFRMTMWEKMNPLIPETKELTMQEIADKFNIPVESLRIKD